LRSGSPSGLDVGLGCPAAAHSECSEIRGSSRIALGKGDCLAARSAWKHTIMGCVRGGLRAVTMSRAWWMALGTAVGECPVDLSPGALQVAIQAGYRRWPDVSAMLKCAVAVEAVGKV